METIGAFFKKVVDRNGPKPATSYRLANNTTEVWTYSELWDRSTTIALWLQERGISKGDRVVLWAQSSPAWVASYFGALRLGIILVPLDLHSSPDYVQKVLDQTEPKLALLSSVTKDNWVYPIPSAMIEDLAVLPPTEKQLQEPDVTPDDIAEVVFTSGTTGTPKGVILTHGNITSDLEGTDQYVPDTPHYRTISLLPLSHMMEQCGGLLLAMKRDASIYYLSTMQPSTVFAALSEHGATAIILVPQVLQLFMRNIEREAEKQGKGSELQRARSIAEHLPTKARRLLFRSVHQRLGGMLEFVVSGGAPIEPELIHKWEIMGIPVIQGYGATETASVVAATPMNDRGALMVGKAIPGVQIKIAPDGEVLIKGPNVMPGYWNNPEATAAAFDEEGWYKSGDLGQLDEKGHLFLHGRKKDMIALANGQKVYPQDVEQALCTVPGVKDAVVVGLPTDQGPQVHAALICEPGVNVEAIIKQANDHLAPHQRVRGHTMWPGDDFPRTFTFKVKKQDVLAALQEMEAEKEKPESTAAVPVA